MKRAFSILLVATWSAVGCESLPRLWEEPKPKPVPVAAQEDRPKPALTAEQVSEANAHAAAEALLREIDRDASGDTLPPRTK
jgi:hypothetical protein